MDSEIKSELMIIIILHDINSLLIDSKIEIEAKKKMLPIERKHIKILLELPFWKLLPLPESFVFFFQLTGRAKGYSLSLSGLL